MPGKLQWWWLSFADPARPVGDEFLGVAIVPGVDFMHAIEGAHLLGCNPGGEVLGYPCLAPPPDARCRLLSKEEMYRLFPDTVKRPPNRVETEKGAETTTLPVRRPN